MKAVIIARTVRWGDRHYHTVSRVGNEFFKKNGKKIFSRSVLQYMLLQHIDQPDKYVRHNSRCNTIN